MPTKPATFRPAGAPTRQEQRRQHDERRGSASARGYDHAWSKASKGHLGRHPLCVGCEAVGRVTAATLTDHIIPHKGDRSLFWDRGNWQSGCGWHHDAVKARLEAMWTRGEIEVSELRLDSETAVRLTRALDPSLGH
jgi:5-methylcytosine-specific restriction endonuclease McrA